MRKSDRNVIVRHHNNGKNSVYSGKLLPACLPAFFYCCKTTKINHQADQKQNTRTANSVTGSLSTCRDRGFPYLLRAPRQLFGWKNARVLRREIFCPFPAAVTVACEQAFGRAGNYRRAFTDYCYSDMDIPISKTLLIQASPFHITLEVRVRVTVSSLQVGLS